MVSDNLNKCGPYNNKIYLLNIYCRLILCLLFFFFNENDFSHRVIRNHIKIKTWVTWVHTKQMSEESLFLEVITDRMYCVIVLKQFSPVPAVR